MLPEVVNAYYEEGYRFRPGSPRLLVSGVQPIGQENYIPAGRQPLPATDWGFSLRDFHLFTLIGNELKPRNALVIGNAFGISVNSIGAALRPIAIDVIDAEVNGDTSAVGAELTRRVASRLDIDLQLTKGFSPQDLDAACRADRYDLAFIDGLHTNEQMIEDYEGVLPRLADRCALVFHDVGLCTMDRAWDTIRPRAEAEGLRPHAVTFTDFGTCVLLRGLPHLDRMLRITCPRLRNANETYHGGTARHPTIPDPERDVLYTTPDTRIAFVGAADAHKAYPWVFEQFPDRVAGIFDEEPEHAAGGLTVRALDEIAHAAPTAIVIGQEAEHLRAEAERLMPSTPIHPKRNLAHPTNIVNYAAIDD